MLLCYATLLISLQRGLPEPAQGFSGTLTVFHTCRRFNGVEGRKWDIR